MCKCLPACEDFWVILQLSAASFPGESFLTSSTADRLKQRKADLPSAALDEYLKKNVVVLNLFYKEPNGNYYRDDIQYDLGDVIGNAVSIKHILIMM